MDGVQQPDFLVLVLAEVVAAAERRAKIAASDSHKIGGKQPFVAHSEFVLLAVRVFAVLVAVLAWSALDQVDLAPEATVELVFVESAAASVREPAFVSSGPLSPAAEGEWAASTVVADLALPVVVGVLCRH